MLRGSHPLVGRLHPWEGAFSVWGASHPQCWNNGLVALLPALFAHNFLGMSLKGHNLLALLPDANESNYKILSVVKGPLSVYTQLNKCPGGIQD